MPVLEDIILMRFTDYCPAQFCLRFGLRFLEFSVSCVNKHEVLGHVRD